MDPKEYDSAQDFIAKIYAGELDGNFAAELKNLTHEQLKRVAEILMDREETRRE